MGKKKLTSLNTTHANYQLFFFRKATLFYLRSLVQDMS